MVPGKKVLDKFEYYNSGEHQHSMAFIRIYTRDLVWEILSEMRTIKPWTQNRLLDWEPIQQVVSLPKNTTKVLLTTFLVNNDGSKSRKTNIFAL